MLKFTYYSNFRMNREPSEEINLNPVNLVRLADGIVQKIYSQVS